MNIFASDFYKTIGDYVSAGLHIPVVSTKWRVGCVGIVPVDLLCHFHEKIAASLFALVVVVVV